MSFTSRARSRWSDLYVVSTVQFFGALANFLVIVTLVLALQRQGASGIEVSILVISEVLPIVVLGKLIGRVVDRFDSRTLLVGSGLAQVLACLFLAQADGFGTLIAGAVALAAASAVALPTRQALVPAIVSRDDLPRANAIGQTAGSAGMMLGPALAGVMVAAYGPKPTLLIAAAAFISAILGGLCIRTRRGGRTPVAPMPDAPAPQPSGSNEWTLRSDRLLWSSVWGLTAVMCTLSAVNVVLVFFIMRTLGSSESLYGIVDAMWTVGLAGGAWLFSRLIRPSTADAALARGVLGVLAGISAAIVLVGLTPAALWIIPCFLIGGTQNGGLNVLTGTLVGRRAPVESRGRAGAAMTMRVQGGALVGYVAGGLVLELAEPRWVVLGCGVLGLATVLAVTPLVRRAAVTPVPANSVPAGQALAPVS